MAFDKNKWQIELLKEKTLYEVFRLTKGIWETPFNKWLTLILMLVSVLWAAALLGLFYVRQASIADIATLMRSWVSIGAVLSATILGFLITGFTVFATLSKPQLFVRLAQVASSSNPAHSEFKVMMARMVNVFVHFLSYLAVSALLQLGFSPFGFIALFAKFALPQFEFALGILGVSFLSLYLVWSGLLFLKLKSFVFNIYGSVMLAVAAFETADQGAGRRPQNAASNEGLPPKPG